MNKLDECPICNSKLIVLMKETGNNPLFSTIIEGFDLNVAVYSTYCRCLECGIIFQSPRMGEEDVLRFYSSGAYRRMTISEERADEDELYRARTDAELLKKIGISPNSHLDIGCSRGFFLDTVGAAKQVGVEVNEEWTKLGSDKLQVFGKVQDVEKYDFDLVSLIHTLEHVFDPISMLDEALMRMRYDGHIMIEVPSNNSPGGWPRLAHLYHFEPWVLIGLLKEMGLKIDYVSFTPHLVVIASIDEVPS